MRPIMSARSAIAEQLEIDVGQIEQTLVDEVAYWLKECEERYEHDPSCPCYEFACWDLREARRKLYRFQLRSTNRLASRSLLHSLLLFEPGQVAS